MDHTHAVAHAPSQTRTRELTSAALVTALLCASAWVAIPVGAVPVTLQTFFVVLAALLLRPRWAGAAVGLYLALGALGLPVFAGGKGGIAVLAGPTGGYLIGFVAAAIIGAALQGWLVRRGWAQTPTGIAAALAAVAVVYILGVWQLAIVLALDPAAAVAAGIAPFIVPDVAKALVAVAVAGAVRRSLRWGGR